MTETACISTFELEQMPRHIAAYVICWHVNRLRQKLWTDDTYTRVYVFVDLLMIDVSTEPYDETIDPGWA